MGQVYAVQARSNIPNNQFMELVAKFCFSKQRKRKRLFDVDTSMPFITVSAWMILLS